MIAVRRFLDAEALREKDYIDLAADFFTEMRKSPVPPRLDRAVERLRVRELQRQAEDRKDTLAVQAARRQLERLFVDAAFYEAREYLAAGEAPRALALLDLAAEIKPRAPIVCYHRARALLLEGRSDSAVAELGCWADAVEGPLARLEQDTALASLRGHPAYEALLARLGGSKR